jgi:hypothetical protein
MICSGEGPRHGLHYQCVNLMHGEQWKAQNLSTWTQVPSSRLRVKGEDLYMLSLEAEYQNQSFDR